MAKKIEITIHQAQRFNKMRYFLLRINKYYMSAKQIAKDGEESYGLSSHEVLEMAYENIQAEAKHAVKGVSEITIPKKKTQSDVVERSVATEAK